MGLRSFFSKLLNPVAVVVTPIFRNLSFAKFFGQAEKMKAAELLKHYRHWVYRASTMNANSVAAVPLRLYVQTNRGQKAYPNMRRGIDTRALDKKQLAFLQTKNNLEVRLRKSVMVEEVIDHPVLDLLQQANQQYDGFELLELFELFAELTGDGFLWAPPGALGAPQSIWVLYSQYVTIVPGESDFVQGYLYGMSKDKEVALPAEEVIHLRFPNPHSIFYGLSPMQAVMAAVKRKEDYDVYEDALLKNNARPDFLIKHKGKVNNKTIKEIRERWQQLYGGGKTGMPAVLEGEMELEQLGFSPRDIAFLKGQIFSRDEILNAYGIPISKVTTEKVNLANAEAGEKQYQADTIAPRLRRLEQKLNQDLLPKFDDRLFVAFDDNVPEDKEFKLQKQESYLDKGVITINEVREEEGLEPVTWGKTPWLSTTLLPVGSGGEPPAKPENNNNAKVMPSLIVVDKDGVHYHMDDFQPGNEKQWYFERRAQMTTIMQRIFREWKKAMLKQLEKMKSMVPAGMNVKGEGVPEWDEYMLEREKWAAEINRRMGKPIREQLVTGGTRGLNRIGAGISFNVLDPEVQTWFDEYTFHFSRITSRTISDDFAAQMKAGFEAGETIPQLQERTRDFFGRMESWKAEMIARSESSRASHMGMLKGWEQSGVVESIVWDAQADACPWCEEMDGKTVALGQPFFEQGQHLDAPFEDAEGNEVPRSLKFNYEPIQSPPLHPNCRCTLRAELKGE